MERELIGERQRLATLASYAILDTAAEPTFDAIVAEMAQAYRVRHALVSFIDADRQWYKARHGVAVQEVARAASFCTHSLHGAGVTVVPDARLDPRFSGNSSVTGAPFVRFYAAAPIRALDRARLGTVCIYDPEPRPGLSTREQHQLALFAARVTEALERRRGDGGPVYACGSAGDPADGDQAGGLGSVSARSR